jgi:ketosteroid isomerase-like protein
MTAPTIPTLDVDALRDASDSHAALAAVIADDIEWIDVSPNRSRTVLTGRAEVLAMLDGLHAGGIVTTVRDGFAAGERAALSVTCAMAEGVIATNALLTVRDGKIARWFGVEAWDA